MVRDKSWVQLDDRRLAAYTTGCVDFLDYAFSHAALDGKIKCNNPNFYNMLKQEIKAELNFKSKIKGNGLCHCVLLEILHEIKFEFSKIRVRMREI